MSQADPSPLPAWKGAFLSNCLSSGVLRFGSFKLKSGRQSPYFFNAGLFHRADLLEAIATAYAQTILSFPLDFDVLFGPAYKGIPLATATTAKLAQLDQTRFGALSYAFNRKEAKDHGEGGSIVGAPLRGKKVVIVDDVITAGTAVREAIEIIAREGGTLVAVVVALDRMEKVTGPAGEDDVSGPSAIGQVTAQYDVPVLAILTLDDIIHGLGGDKHVQDVERMADYRRRYRPTDY